MVREIDLAYFGSFKLLPTFKFQLMRFLPFKSFILLLTMLIGTCLHAQDKPAYTIFTKSGAKANYQQMLDHALKADVTFFGELHNNSLGHWLQLQLTSDVFKKEQSLTLAFEMFEADIQYVVDEYMNGMIDERNFLKDARVWDNYKTDYKPLVEFAKKNKLPVLATNIPRRYANLVYRKGAGVLDSLGNMAKQSLPPIPFDVDLSLPGYKEMITTMGGHGASGTAELMAVSQASKDAAMAYFTSKYITKKVIHFNGAYHSKDDEGILWYLRKYRPNLKIVTIHMVEQADISTLASEHLNSADYIICIPADMAKSY